MERTKTTDIIKNMAYRNVSLQDSPFKAQRDYTIELYLSLQNGDDIKTVSENLGHETVAFTLDVYGHVTEKMKKDSADRMQAFIESL